MAERNQQPDDPGVGIQVVHLSSVVSAVRMFGAALAVLVSVIGGGAWFLATSSKEQATLAEGLAAEEKRLDGHIARDDILYTSLLSQLTALREGQVRVETKLDAAVQPAAPTRK